MYPILFRIGDTFIIHTYTVLIDLGILAALGLAFWLWRRHDRRGSSLLDAATGTLVGAVILGRTAFVALHWEYYSTRLPEVLAIWSGGISFHGALLGGVIGLWLATKLVGSSFWPAADVLAAGTSLGAIFGWLGCLAAGRAYGIPFSGTFSIFSPDIYGIEAPRFPLQLMGAALSAAILVILLLLLRKRVFAGTPFLVFLLLYFGSMFVLDFWRGDEALWLGEIRLSQVVSAVMGCLALALLLFRRGGPATESGMDSHETYPSPELPTPTTSEESEGGAS